MRTALALAVVVAAAALAAAQEELDALRPVCTLASGAEGFCAEHAAGKCGYGLVGPASDVAGCPCCVKIDCAGNGRDRCMSRLECSMLGGRSSTFAGHNDECAAHRGEDGHPATCCSQLEMREDRWRCDNLNTDVRRKQVRSKLAECRGTALCSEPCVSTLRDAYSIVFHCRPRRIGEGGPISDAFRAELQAKVADYHGSCRSKHEPRTLFTAKGSIYDAAAVFKAANGGGKLVTKHTVKVSRDAPPAGLWRWSVAAQAEAEFTSPGVALTGEFEFSARFGWDWLYALVSVKVAGGISSKVLEIDELVDAATMLWSRESQEDADKEIERQLEGTYKDDFSAEASRRLSDRIGAATALLNKDVDIALGRVTAAAAAPGEPENVKWEGIFAKWEELVSGCPDTAREASVWQKQNEVLYWLETQIAKYDEVLTDEISVWTSHMSRREIDADFRDEIAVHVGEGTALRTGAVRALREKLIAISDRPACLAPQRIARVRAEIAAAVEHARPAIRVGWAEVTRMALFGPTLYDYAAKQLEEQKAVDRKKRARLLAADLSLSVSAKITVTGHISSKGMPLARTVDIGPLSSPTAAASAGVFAGYTWKQTYWPYDHNRPALKEGGWSAGIVGGFTSGKIEFKAAGTLGLTGTEKNGLAFSVQVPAGDCSAEKAQKFVERARHIAKAWLMVKKTQSIASSGELEGFASAAYVLLGERVKRWGHELAEAIHIDTGKRAEYERSFTLQVQFEFGLLYFKLTGISVGMEDKMTVGTPEGTPDIRVVDVSYSTSVTTPIVG